MAGLYIHIPFCASRCAYCDFYSTTSRERIAEYVEALKREMTARRFGNLEIWKFGNELDAEGNFQIFKSSNLQISTIYIGGGTPSMLSPSELRELLGQAASLWDCSGLREVTLEANPEELTRDYLAGLAGSFNRLSIGIQSFDDGLLRFMNRRHDARRAREAVREAQAAGFDNISIDLIYGIPGMTSGQWECTLREAIALDVQHISAYHLTIEPATPFGRMGLAPIPEAGSERQFETLREKLLAAGFEHYEVSNFALAGRHAIHNSAYWSGEPYLGVGPSAHSFDGVRRREWVAADVQKYMEAFAEPSPRQAAIYESETLSERELRNERIMTGLRTARGVEAKILEAKSDETERFLREGLLVERGDRLAIPPEKFLLSDYVIASLFDA